ncbi:MAG: DNA polymerase III subunit delta [Nitrospiria bacterium]
MTPQEAIRNFDKGNFSPCYLLAGEEAYFTQGLLQRFREKALDPAVTDFNLDQFRGEAVNAEEVILIAGTFPLSSPRRLILIQDADRIKDEMGHFLDYLDRPSATTVLVFSAAKPDMRKKLFSTLKKKATVINCTRLREKEIPAWIAREGRKKRLRFSDEALWYIKERLGNDLFLIQQEIEKIALYVAVEDQDKEMRVSTETVLEVIGSGKSHSIFELTGAVADRNSGRSLRLLADLLAEGEHPLFILTMLTRQWRMMAIAKEMINSGAPASAVRGSIRLPPSLLAPFLQQLKKWSSDEIQWAFELSLAADSQLKGGTMSPSFVLEAILLDLCKTGQSAQGKEGYASRFQTSY